MSTAKHSPGPWKLGGGKEVMQLLDADDRAVQGNLLNYGRHLTAEQAFENAQLMAASKELLAALKKIVKDARGDYNAAEDTLVRLNARHIEVTALYAIHKVEPDFL